MHNFLRCALVAALIVSLAHVAIAADSKGACILNDASYGRRLPASTKAVALWWASSGWKIGQDRPVPSRWSKAIAVSLAQNETEAAQLVINPASKLEGLTVDTGAITGPKGATLPAGSVEVLRVRYVNVERPSDASGAVAAWPDPLPTFKAPIDVPAGKNQPLWIRVSVPKGVAPGDYRGVVSLRAKDYKAEAPLRIHVYGFELPDKLACETAFGFDAGAVYRYQNLKDNEQRRQVLDLYWQSLSKHHITPYHFTPNHEPKVDWVKLTPEQAQAWPESERALRQQAAVTPVFDWTQWDAEMRRVIDKFHFSSFRLGLPGMGGGAVNGFNGGTPERALAFQAYAHQFQEHLRAKGWLGMEYVYWTDEPTVADYPGVLDGFLELKQAAPDIRRMLTEQPEPGLFGGPNLWCPITNCYKHDKADARRAEGERFWWYVCTVPKRPFCGLFIDHPATDLRVWLWQTWKYNIGGILVWQSNLWTTPGAYPDSPQNPYEDSMSWEHGNGVKRGEKRPWGNGDGRFMYPPEAAANANPAQPVLDGPVDTIRWEMLRDGLEDYEYLATLKRLLNKNKGKLSNASLEKLTKLTEVPAAITADLKTYTKDPAPVEKQRQRIARAIEELTTKN